MKKASEVSQQLPYTDGVPQHQIVSILQKYLDIKRNKERASIRLLEFVPMRTTTLLPVLDLREGLCSGLVAFKLYCWRIGSEKLDNMVAKILQWDSELFRASAALSDPLLDEFLNAIGFLQVDPKLRPQYGHGNIAASMNLLFDPDDLRPQVAAPEFSMAFVFNKTTLAALLHTILRNNKMIRIENIFHSVGAMLMDDKIYFYNPHQTMICESITRLVEAIYTSLTPYCHSEEYIMLHIGVSDLLEHDPAKQIAEYPSNTDLYSIWMQNLELRTALLQHPNALRMGFRFDTNLLHLLFALGYTYQPWQYNKTCELEEIVLREDEQKLRYAIAHGIPVDYRVTKFKGYTALGRAIIHDKPYMLYLLLLAGSDPKIEHNQGMTAAMLAISFQSTAALIILLARDPKLTETEQELLKCNYTETEASAIHEHAASLRDRLFKSSSVPEVLPEELHDSKQLLFSERPDPVALQIVHEKYDRVIKPLLII